MRKAIYVLILGAIVLIGVSIRNLSNKDIETEAFENISKNDYEDLIIKCGNTNEKLLALTFDDGPDEDFTPQILDILKKYDVKATFYVIGEKVQYNKKIIKREFEEGHEIGNHTFSHPDISNLSSDDIKREIKECEDTLVKLTGKRPTLFRPPYGSYSEEKLGEIAKESGYKIILWTTIDAKDWKNPPPSQISDTIINKAKNGDIILLHDYGTENTVKALDTIIPEMIKKGYKFVTVSELINK